MNDTEEEGSAIPIDRGSEPRATPQLFPATTAVATDDNVLAPDQTRFPVPAEAVTGGWW